MCAQDGSNTSGNEELGRLKSVADLVEIAGTMNPSNVVVAGGDRVEDLRLVESARDHGIIDRIILIGEKTRILKSIEIVGIDIPLKDIVAAENFEEVAEATVELIKSGDVNIVLKGNISTPVINRRMLPLAVRSTVSLSTIFDADPIAESRPMILTDAGVTTVCTFGRMVDLVNNAVDVARVVMGIDKPRVAILSANEKQIPSLPSTWIGQRLADRNWDHAVVYGPLSFDLATDPGSVAIKGLPDHPNAYTVAGKADILVCPGIDAANILYKTLAALSKYGMASLAGITMGFPVPYIILSRSDSLCIRLESIALCSIYFQSKKSEKKRPLRVRKTLPPRIVALNPFPSKIEAALFEGKNMLDCREFSLFELETASGPSNLLMGSSGNITVKNIALWAKSAGTVDAVAAPLWRKEEGFFAGEPGHMKPGGHKRAAPVDRKFFGALYRNTAIPYRQRAVFAACALSELMNVPAYAVFLYSSTTGLPKEAAISGYAGIIRTRTPDAPLIHFAVKKAECLIGRSAQDMNLIVALLGDTSTVAAVERGKITDSTGPPPDSGPFSMHTSGDLPLSSIIDLIFSKKYTKERIVETLSEQGGLLSYLSENDLKSVAKRINDGDEHARCVLDAMVFQHVKHIGAMCAACGFDVDAILLGGKLTESPSITKSLRHQLGRIAPVFVFEGSLELEFCAAEVAGLLTTGKTGKQTSVSEERDPGS
jgi:butyrate kinase